MSVSADTGSKTDAGHRKPLGGAFSYASSMTSGGIHLVDESECKPQNLDKEPRSNSPAFYSSSASSYASYPYPSHTLPGAVGVHEAQMTTDDNTAPQGHKHGPSPHHDRFLDLPIENSEEGTLCPAISIESSPAPQRSSSRVQKLPATFQCTLCPKKFTRAYNLRSHLRTHTDDRPFVCSVCHKAFARQHDRKRHENLHSGAKKLICRGELSAKAGQTWGCGRRFARAEALGRHFRSEAGQICIKPLLDEEKAERQKQAREIGMQSLTASPYVSASNFPAALIAQYPALATIDWTAIEPEKVDFDPGELSDINATDHGYTEDE